MGYPIKLDTNGSRPGILKRLIDQGLIDYVAMDIKTDPFCYGDSYPRPWFQVNQTYHNITNIDLFF